MSADELAAAATENENFRELLIQLKMKNNFFNLNKGSIFKCCRQIVKRIFPTKRARKKLVVTKLPVALKTKIYGSAWHAIEINLCVEFISCCSAV